VEERRRTWSFLSGRWQSAPDAKKALINGRKLGLPRCLGTGVGESEGDAPAYIHCTPQIICQDLQAKVFNEG